MQKAVNLEFADLLKQKPSGYFQLVIVLSLTFLPFLTKYKKYIKYNNKKNTTQASETMDSDSDINEKNISPAEILGDPGTFSWLTMKLLQS